MKEGTSRAGFLQTVKDEFSHEISKVRSFRRRGTLPLGDMEEMNLSTTPSISERHEVTTWSRSTGWNSTRICAPTFEAQMRSALSCSA
jgi:hypothetical protein